MPPDGEREEAVADQVFDMSRDSAQNDDQGDIVGVVSDGCFGCRGETGTKGENNTQTYTCTRQLSSRHEDQECELVRASRSELSSSFREHADHPESQEGRAHRSNSCLGGRATSEVGSDGTPGHAEPEGCANNITK